MTGTVFLVLWLFVATSCNKRELDTRPLPPAEQGVIDFPVDWEGRVAPSGLRFYFYPSSGEAPLVRDCPAQGFHDTLPAGTYRALVVNTDFRGVKLSDMEHYETARVELLPPATRSDAGLSLVGQPVNVWALSLNALSVESESEAAFPQARFRSCVHTVRLSFDIQDPEELSSLEGHLQGVYPSVLLAGGEPSEEARAAAASTFIPFSVALNKEGGECTVGVLGILSPDGGSAYHNVLRLSATGTEGEVVTTEVDLTEELSRVLGSGSGELPQELSIRVSVDIRFGPKPEMIAVATVQGWNNGGEINGEVWE